MIAPTPGVARRRAVRSRPPSRAQILLAFGLAMASPKSATADPIARAPSPCTAHAAEAAARSALSEAVILRVMHVESRGRATAISPKGAMGCMQIMPATWRYLTARHRLGSDPWNARFNMIGGALYLAELARQFGFPGAYAAYNAGPARYARHIRGAGPLPAETVAYMASLTGTAPPHRAEARSVNATPPRWQEAGLFLRVDPARAATTERAASVAELPKAAKAKTDLTDSAKPSPPGGLFPLEGQ